MAEYDDAAVSGADPIETRRGFAELLDRIEGNGVRMVIVEDASRFARELITQELFVVCAAWAYIVSVARVLLGPIRLHPAIHVGAVPFHETFTFLSSYRDTTTEQSWSNSR